MLECRTQLESSIMLSCGMSAYLAIMAHVWVFALLPLGNRACTHSRIALVFLNDEACAFRKHRFR